jgi:murein DD-endopeptidase MepM/ murein hydrolase activator NlpD
MPFRILIMKVLAGSLLPFIFMLSSCSNQDKQVDMLPVADTNPPKATATLMPAVDTTIIVLETLSLQQLTEFPNPTEEEDGAQTCSGNLCVFPGHFVFRSPIADGYNQTVERSYPYGSTQNGNREPHHGVEFINASGTPVLAAGDGKVIIAGNDSNQEIGWGINFYGKLVVIEHKIPGFEQPIFTLYGHLSQVLVMEGESVQTGDTIGEVGLTGRALGSHLHFEVREGVNDYAHTRNPELWLKMGREKGALVGQITNDAGVIRRYPGFKVVAMDLPDILNFSPQPYADASLNGDSIFQEVFALADLLPGKYEISFTLNGKVETQEIEIFPGSVTRVTFHTKY